MNRSKWMPALMLGGAIALAVALLVKRQAPPAAPVAQPTLETAMPATAPAEPAAVPEGIAPAPETGPAPALEPVATAPEPLKYSHPIRETKVLQEGAEPKEVVRVRPEQVLAAVNGVPITLKDLAAVPGASRGLEHTISASLYDTLLERAVVRQVAMQAAKAQGITLTAEQQAQLEKIKTELTASSDEVKDLTMSSERLAFDLRDTEGRMLLVNLAARAGAPTAFVTEEQVQAYYEGHKADYGELPADPQEAEWAWRKIDREIRNVLVEDTTAAYQQAYDKVVEDLKAQATIAITPTDAP